MKKLLKTNCHLLLLFQDFPPTNIKYLLYIGFVYAACKRLQRDTKAIFDYRSFLRKRASEN